MKKKILWISSLFFLTCSHFALAVNRPGAATFSLGIGPYIFADKRHITNTSLPNIAIAQNINANWAVEALVGIINTHQENPLGTAGVHGTLYLADVLYRLNATEMWEPYFSGGIGVLALNPNGTSSNNQGNINAGFGVQVFFDESIALRVEAKDIYTLSGGKNDGMINFSVSFLFGGEASVNPPLVEDKVAK